MSTFSRKTLGPCMWGKRACNTVKLRGTPKTEMGPKRRWGGGGGWSQGRMPGKDGLNFLPKAIIPPDPCVAVANDNYGRGNDPKDVTMDDPQPSPTKGGRSSSTKCPVERLEGSRRNESIRRRRRPTTEIRYSQPHCESVPPYGKNSLGSETTFWSWGSGKNGKIFTRFCLFAT